MGTSIGQVTDYLLNRFRNGFTGTDPYGAPLAVQSLPAINPLVEVADVSATLDSGAWVIVGRAGLNADAEIVASAEYQVLGRQRVTESYSLPCMILVFGDGPDWGPVRAAALALFDGALKIVWADPTLAGILQQGRIGLVDQFTLKQHDPTTEDTQSSGAAVGAEISFALQVENSYVP
jgi:hypothetical protein